MHEQLPGGKERSRQKGKFPISPYRGSDVPPSNRPVDPMEKGTDIPPSAKKEDPYPHGVY